MKYYKHLCELLTNIKYYKNIQTPPFPQMKRYNNLTELFSQTKYYKNIRIPASQMKYCDGKAKYVHIYDCECLHNCKFVEHTNHIPYHRPLICSLTNTYKKDGDCICDEKCSATQNDLELLFV